MAKVMDVDLTERDIEEWYSFFKILAPQGKTSMLQDIEAGRKTEIEIFGDNVVELGKAHGVPTPVNQALFRIVRYWSSSR